jgi:hypothetical protein
MATHIQRRSIFIIVLCACLASLPAPAHADEIWVAPTAQADLGGLGIGSNVFWPVTAVGVVRLAWGVPNNLQTFQNAKLVLIPHAPAGSGTLNLFVCRAQNSDLVGAACTGPLAHAFTGVTNELLEVDVSAAIGAQVGAAGLNYLAVLAYTTPTTVTDHIVGLRFAYAPMTPVGVATLGANTFTGTQTAPAFVGDGSALTNVNAALLNGVSSSAFAPAVHGHDVSQVTNAASLAANTFTGTQTINNGNLDLDSSTPTAGNLTRNGTLFMHDRGTFNTFLGQSAGAATTFASANTAVGTNALAADTTGGGNTAVGSEALAVNVTGGENTAIGWRALKANTGSANAAIGYEALGSNGNGSANIAVGEYALGSNTLGYGNSAVGYHALQSLTGSFTFGNVAVGHLALGAATSGFNNVAVGGAAGLNATTGINNIYLGTEVRGTAGESNTIYLGREGIQNKTLIAGIRGITTGADDAIPVVIDSFGQLGTISSSRRYKEDIHDMADASRRLLQLRPVTFRYTQAYVDGAKPIQYGLIAEEVAEIFPELAVRGADGRVETVHYETLNVLLLNELQKQQRRIESLEAQERRIESLERMLSELKAAGGEK